MAPCNGSQSDQGPTCVSIIIMGVSGTGKSTLGTALAKVLNMPYVEGDELHPKSNIDKMSSGHPLTDADREPWLELIRTTAEHMTVEKQVEQHAGRPEDVLGVIIGCSALKKYYRDILRGIKKPASKSQVLPHHLEPAKPDVLLTYFVFIDGPEEVLKERMEHRPGHYMKVSMLDSQLRTLESPIGETGVLSVPMECKTEDQVKMVIEGLNEAGLCIGRR